MPRRYVSKQAWKELRGRSALRVHEEIRRLKGEGKSIPDIVATLNVAKGIAVRSFNGQGDRAILRRVLEDASVDSLLILAEGLETVKSEVVQMKTLSALGELRMSPEQLGTFLRAMEKTAELIHIMSGQPASKWKEVNLPATEQDTRLAQARRTLELLDAKQESQSTQALEETP